jgi:DNA-binding IscR family transcriptional regulator
MIAEYAKEHVKITGDFCASSVQANPTIIRNIMAQLRDAGLLNIQAGTGGAKLTRPPENITLKDVFLAVNPTKNGQLFKIHPNPSKICPVGSNVSAILTSVFEDAQNAMLNELGKHALSDLISSVHARNKAKAAAAFSH